MWLCAFSPAAALSDAELIRLRDSFESRRDAMFQLVAAHPLKVAAKRPPLGPGRAAYTRHYSFSIISFALKAFWLNEFVDEANAALVENCRYYLEDKQARDDRDSFYWSTDLLCRLVELFGRNGSRAPRRLTAKTEDVMLQLMWAYCSNVSRLADAEFEQSRTWHLRESENHHIQRFSTLWHFLRFLARSSAYRDRKLQGGGSPAEHCHAWTEYSKEYLRERVRKGLFVEMANKGYNLMTLKGLYNFHDFADDPELRRLAKCVLDLYWATWAEEQLDGVRGGGASRVYPGPMSRQRDGDAIGRVAAFYLGTGESRPPHDTEYTVLTSTYRMPLVVMDLALDAVGRGVYEIRQRRMGLAEPGFHTPPDYRLRTGNGGLVRYSYCTPDFIMGTAMLEARPLEDWAMISSQNRWHGVLFAGHPDARIFPQCEAKKNTYNQQWSVQRKGTLIAQKLPGNSGAGGMRVWLGRHGLSNRTEQGGWVFVDAQGAHAAVRPARAGYTWEVVDEKAAGDWLRCESEWSPVIIEVARRTDFATAEAFRAAVLALPCSFEGDVLTYRGLAGDTFTFYADHSQPPAVNGEPTDYAPPLVFDSPFIRSEWNSGVVTIRKGERELVVNVSGPD